MTRMILVLGVLAAAAAAFGLFSCEKVDAVKKDIQKQIDGGGGSGAAGGAGGGEGAAQATPSATIQSYKDAIAKQDWEKLYGLMSAEFQRRTLAEVDRMKKVLASGSDAEKKAVVERIRKLGMTPEEFAQADADKLAVRELAQEVLEKSTRLPTAVRDVKGIKITGDRATVDFVDEAGATGTLKFVKESGVWKVGE
ncbi:MAG: hypothetical protein HZA54_18705 [Planctomycetes bacterium]|nr:hypothetical protein [Planctomycetota bacterium]